MAAVAAVVGVVLALAAGAAGSHSRSGGTFRLGTPSGIDSLNPYVAFNQDAYSTFEYIYPVLVRIHRQQIVAAHQIVARFLAREHQPQHLAGLGQFDFDPQRRATRPATDPSALMLNAAGRR